MYVVRNVFKCKAGEAKHLVTKFKSVFDVMQEHGFNNPRIMTDTVSNYWTVVFEVEVETPGAYFDATDNMPREDERMKGMDGYMDHVESGYREIFKVE